MVTAKAPRMKVFSHPSQIVSIANVLTATATNSASDGKTFVTNSFEGCYTYELLARNCFPLSLFIWLKE